MITNLKNFRSYIINGDITSSVLDIISNCSYFSAKKIRFELYKKHGITLRGRPSSQIDISNDLHLKMILSCRIGHITRRLKKRGYIEKVNQKTWKKITQIDLNDLELYSNVS